MKLNRLSLIGLLLSVLTPIAQADPLSAKLENARFKKEASAVTLEFVLTNQSKEPIRIAERWNTWGAFQWTIQMTNADGSKVDFVNPAWLWHRNFLTVMTIEPGREFRTACVLLLPDGESQEKDAAVFKAITPNAHFSPPLTLTGRFAAGGPYKGRHGDTNWKGVIESAPIEIAR